MPHETEGSPRSTVGTAPGITNEEWDITLGHIGATLDALGVAAQEKSEVLAAAASGTTNSPAASKPEML
jgi:hypothetical protein